MDPAAPLEPRLTPRRGQGWSGSQLCSGCRPHVALQCPCYGEGTSLWKGGTVQTKRGLPLEPRGAVPCAPGAGRGVLLSGGAQLCPG